MKLKNIGCTALATVLSLGIGLGAVACSRDYTAAYVYAPSAANGTVAAYAVDYQSGALTQIAGSPFSGAGRNPRAVVATPNGKYLYTINHDDNNITVFAVGTDGKLYGQQTPSLAVGSFPTAAAIDPQGLFLYVAFTLQLGYTTASPGKGGIAIFAINQSNGQLGTPALVPVGYNPVSIAVSEPFCSTAPLVPSNPTCNGSSSSHYNSFVYVLDQETAPTAPNILGFSQNMTSGALTLLSGSSCTTTLSVPCTGYPAGVQPSAIAIEPSTRYVYVTDAITNQILGYQVASNTTGNLTGLVSSPYLTGQYPVSLIVDPTGQYVLTANYNSATITSFTINLSNGSLGGTATGGNVNVSTGPTCVTVEPALGKYVYTSNSLDSSISGEVLNQNTGGMTAIANTPFPTSTLPACITSVANGAHARSVINE
jgi:6-phosphogluconolactonase